MQCIYVVSYRKMLVNLKSLSRYIVKLFTLKLAPQWCVQTPKLSEKCVVSGPHLDSYYYRSELHV